MPLPLSPSQDPVTGQLIYEVPEGLPATFSRRRTNADYVWSTTKIKTRGKKVWHYLIDNDFAYIESIGSNDILSLPSDPSAYQFLPAPLIEDHVIVVDQRSRTNVLALIYDPSGIF